MKKVILFSLIAINLLVAQEKADYSPKFSGYLRAWHQTDFGTNQGQFLLKQVRLGINGAVNEYASYKFLVDFTRLGKLTTTTTTINGTKVVTGATANFSDILLDAAAVLSPFKSLDITAGQFKVPFSTDNLRSDQNADFSNRPLHTNISPTIRDIGVMATYKLKGEFNAELSAGTFNGTGMNKTENDKSMDYVFRAVVAPLKGLSLSGNYYGGKAQGADLSFYNFGFDYKLGALFLDAEYASKNTQTVTTDISGNSFFAFATYNIPLEGNFLREMIAGFRFEKYDPNTSADNNEIDMMTFGVTFEFAKITFARFRINYELFDYKDGRDNPDRLIFELQTRF
ncbi:MAG: porin [Melioribacteraceae bacterium]